MIESGAVWRSDNDETLPSSQDPIRPNLQNFDASTRSSFETTYSASHDAVDH